MTRSLRGAALLLCMLLAPAARAEGCDPRLAQSPQFVAVAWLSQVTKRCVPTGVACQPGKGVPSASRLPRGPHSSK